MKQKSTELKGEIDNTMIIDTDLIIKGEAADCSSRTNAFERLFPGPRLGHGLWAVVRHLKRRQGEPSSSPATESAEIL